MGGYGAAKLSLKFPHLFRGFVSQSGPLDLTRIGTLRDCVLSEYDHGPPFTYEFGPDKRFSRLADAMAKAFLQGQFPLDSNGNLMVSVLDKFVSKWRAW